MEPEDERPFALEGDYASFGEAFPSVASLSVTVRALSLVHETVRTRQYDERTLPSHAECPNCGQEAAVGWFVADLVDAGKAEFQVTLGCRGLERVGRDCPYGFRLEGSVEYVED
jgi:hypothetical protein